MIVDNEDGLVAFAFPINPEPWAIGNVSSVKNKKTGKSFPKVAPNHTLQQYQNALRSELEEAGAELLESDYMLRMWFWRQVSSYTSLSGKRASRNSADGTNLFKGTEDALQGVLIDNDAHVMRGDWRLVAQGKEVEPMVLVELWYGLKRGNLFEDIMPADETRITRAAITARNKAVHGTLNRDVILNNEWNG